MLLGQYSQGNRNKNKQMGHNQAQGKWSEYPVQIGRWDIIGHSSNQNHNKDVCVCVRAYGTLIVDSKMFMKKQRAQNSQDNFEEKKNEWEEQTLIGIKSCYQVIVIKIMW